MVARNRKPRFLLRDWQMVEPFLREIANDLANSRHYRSTDFWPQVASDRLDGWATPDEVRPLVRRGLLTTIHDGGCGCKHRCDAGITIAECGHRGPTWHLTLRGLRLLAPDHPAIAKPGGSDVS